MTREKAKKMLKVMQHYVDGGEIEFYSSMDEGWVDIHSPEFLVYNDYRIKPPQKKNIPWTLEDVPLPLPNIRAKSLKKVRSIIACDWNMICVESYNVTYSKLAEDYEYYDTETKTWKPCTKEINK